MTSFKIFVCTCLLLAFACRAQAECVTDIPGDLSGDCTVDIDDLAIVIDDWLTSADPHEWLVRYDGPASDTDQPADAAVDSQRNLYVTGASYGSTTQYDYATVKYSPDGNQPVWVARYDGPANEADEPYAIVIDGNDNIYVTGQGTGDGTFSDYTTLKYHADSNQPVWVARYDGPDSGDDIAYSAAVDSLGNLYVTGQSYGIGTNADCTTVKYSPDSNQPVWVARYDGPANGDDAGYAIAVDSNDNIYVAAAGTGPGTSSDYITIKYSPDSNQPVWVARYDGPANDADEPYAIVIDDNNNIYVAGQSTGDVTFSDYTTIKYRPDSNQPVWVARYDGPAGANDIACCAAVDSQGNIYVTGLSDSGYPSFLDYTTIKYSKDSNQPVWVATYAGPDDSSDIAWRIAVDSSDDVYVTGDSFSSTTSVDYATIKYRPNSNQPVWVAHYNTLVEADIDVYNGSALAIDADDNVYVTAGDAVSGTFTDFVALSYSPDLSCAPDVTGDLDYNCRVDFADFAILADHWLEASTPTDDDTDTDGEPQQPHVSTGRPYVSTTGPEVSTRKPHVSTREPNVSTNRPLAPAQKPDEEPEEPPPSG
ncbi:MAG: SBBP repeat-containing protein [Planctomycetota bacterium]|jgi:hypothetical protein